MPQNVINRYHFSVDWGGARISFIEVSGLNIEIEAVAFKDGTDLADNVKIFPGQRKFSHITLKRELAKGDNDFLIG